MVSLSNVVMIGTHRAKHRLVNLACTAGALPLSRARFVALAFILRKRRGVMVNPAFTLSAHAAAGISRRNAALIGAQINSEDWGHAWGRAVQRKVFRIEQTLPVRRGAAAHGANVSPKIAAGDLHPTAAQVDLIEPTPALKHEFALLQSLVARHKRDLATLIGDGDDRRMTRACGELGAAVESMEKGADTILKSTESIDDSARALAATLTNDYEGGLAQDIQDHTVRIFEACNFQDLASQRIGKVIATLNEVENLLVQMLARCDGAPVSSIAAAPARGSGLLNGPKLDGDSGHASQRDIDAMFG